MTTAFQEELSEMAKYAARENARMRERRGHTTWDSESQARLQQAKAKQIGRTPTTCAKIEQALRNARSPLTSLEIGSLHEVGVSRDAANSALHTLKAQGKVKRLDKRGPRGAVYWVAV